MGGPGYALLRDPLAGLNADEESEPLSPTRTMINVGPSAYQNLINIPDHLKPFIAWATYTDLTER
jgi:hypothetical protein